MAKIAQPSVSSSKSEKTKCQCCIPVRYLIAVLGMMGTFMIYICRINLSVAIIVMAGSQNKSTTFNKTLEKGDVCFTQLNLTKNSTIESKGEFEDWTETKQGVILGAFFYGYILLMAVGGRLAEVFGAKWLCSGGVILSILINFVTPTAARFNYYVFLGSRVLLGLSQSVIFPCLYALFAKWAPDHERSTMFSLPAIGGNLGTIASSSLSGYLARHVGWPSVFYASGTIAAVWLVIWVLFVRSEPDNHPLVSKSELKFIQSNISGFDKTAKKKLSLPWKKIFTSKPFLAMIFVKFTMNWTFMIVMLKLPAYLKAVFNYPIDQNGLLSSMVYTSLAVSLFSFGMIADNIVKRNIVNKTTLRKSFEIICALGTSICLVLIPLCECREKFVIALLVASMIPFGMQAGGDIPNVADLSNKYPATLFAIANSIAMTNGFLVPLITGMIIEYNPKFVRQQWGIVFYLSSAIGLFGGIVYVLFGTAEQQDWDEEEVPPKGKSLEMVSRL